MKGSDVIDQVLGSYQSNIGYKKKTMTFDNRLFKNI